MPSSTRAREWDEAQARDLEEDSKSDNPLPKPSKYQQAFLKWIKNGKGNASLIAVAGAGKTTTLHAATFAMPAGTDAYAVVFNKKNADELKAKFPKHVVCGTFHSIWMRSCRANLGNNVKVDDNKTREIILRVLPSELAPGSTSRHVLTPAARPYGTLVRALVGHAKNAGVGLILRDVAATWGELIDHYDMQIDEKTVRVPVLIDYAQRVLALSNSTLNMIDFDDMLYLPLINKWGIEPRDFVFVDEAQDSNAVQRALVARMVRTGGRIIFVGDPHQAIYGFRGATSNAMDVIQEQFKTTALPLTVSYRCPKAVVKYAQRYVKHIEAHSDAPEGSVISKHNGLLPRSMLTPDTAIVCRTTAPLVTLAFQLIGKRIACKILGRDIGTRLRELVERMYANNLEELTTRIESWRMREVIRAEEKENEALAQSINDQADSIVAMCSSMQGGASVADLIHEINRMFTNDPTMSSVTLCTVHKAKGLEWPRVIEIRPDLIPLPWVKKPWQIEQEINIAYVAATRAKDTLVIVDGESVYVEDNA